MSNKFLPILLLISFPLIASSQVHTEKSPIQTDTRLWMGQISYTSNTGEYFKQDGNALTRFQASPTFMQFMRPNFAFGLSVFYQGEWQGTLRNSYSVGAGPVIAYFWDLEKRDIYPYGTLFFHILNQSSIPKEPPRERVSYLGPQVGVGVGIASMLSDNIALLTSLEVSFLNMSYIKDKAEYQDPAMTSAVGYTIQLSIGVAGFAY